jgi:hypothetical protein
MSSTSGARSPDGSSRTTSPITPTSMLPGTRSRMGQDRPNRNCLRHGACPFGETAASAPRQSMRITAFRRSPILGSLTAAAARQQATTGQSREGAASITAVVGVTTVKVDHRTDIHGRDTHIATAALTFPHFPHKREIRDFPTLGARQSASTSGREFTRRNSAVLM